MRVAMNERPSKQCHVVTAEWVDAIVALGNSARAGWDEHEPFAADELVDDLEDDDTRFWACGSPGHLDGFLFATVEGECLLCEFPYLNSLGDLETTQTLLLNAEDEAKRLGVPLEITIPMQQVGEQQVLAGLGFKPSRVVHRMLLSSHTLDRLPVPSWPPSRQIHTFENPDTLQLLDVWRRCFGDQYRENFLSEKQLLEQRARPNYHPTDQMLILLDNVVIGMSQTNLTGDIGWIDYVGILAAHRGLGYGRNMTLHLCHSLASRGAVEIRLGVDTFNPYFALRVYERIGFVTEQAWQRFSRP